MFAPPITYVLECKWGLIHKQSVNEFFDVLRWSKEFGADTEKGRSIRQGVIGLFAGNTFNPHEKVFVNGKEISLATYANQMNIQLLKASNFNKRLHERGARRVTKRFPIRIY